MHLRYFIAATGTGIGKSFITAALVRQAKAHAQSVAAFKPVISGFNDCAAEDSDAALLLRSLEKPLNAQNITHISRWRFAAPLAPSMAARQEKKPLDFAELVAHSHKLIAAPEDIVLIEGVGGVMVPLTDYHTVLDWLTALEIPVLLVAGSYLGTISHTLTAMTVLAQKNVPVRAIILNESEEIAVPLAETEEELKRWSKALIIKVARRASDDGWQDVPELKALLD